MTNIQKRADEIPDNMFISIIIPVYNDQDGLNRVLKSLQSQTTPATRFEVIVIDNNSEPAMKPCSTIAIPYAIYTCSTPGSYAARNYGVEKSKGDILVFLDAGCYPSPQWLESGVDAVLNNKDSVIGGDVLFEQSVHPTAVEQYQYLTGIENETTIANKGYTGAGNLFTTAKVFNSVGEFDETLFSGGDKEWCWRARSKGFEIQFCSQAVVYTKARRSLRKAIIQARRIAGGRKQLRELESLPLKKRQDIAPHRNPLRASTFIFSQKQLSYLNRVKIFFVASILKIAHVTETIRLSLGSKAERR